MKYLALAMVPKLVFLIQTLVKGNEVPCSSEIVPAKTCPKEVEPNPRRDESRVVVFKMYVSFQ